MVDEQAVSMSRMPVLVILGSTGTGKSRLGIELAKRFSGEIISADSMQVYKELDIITAKVTEEEKLIVPHHMLDVVDPLINYCVTDYQRAALPIIKDVTVRRKLPIIVGGTNYYIESLLWHVLLTDPQLSGNDDRDIFSSFSGLYNHSDVENHISYERKNNMMVTPPQFLLSKKMKHDDSIVSNESLHQKLTAVDPEMARRLHPNDRRKVIRSLEVFENHGTTHSEILKKQRSAGGCSLGGPLRFSNSVILWLCCDPDVLDKRLDQRVDSMVEAGLIHELSTFHRRFVQEWTNINLSPDYTKGIFQSIGFKEFHNYLILSDDEKKSDKGQFLFNQGIENLKIVTKRYARRQQRWIMNRFIKRNDRQVPPVYDLNCTNVDRWDTDVLEPAIELLNTILENKNPKRNPIQASFKQDNGKDKSNEESYWCETCEKVLIGGTQWNAHRGGSKHKKMSSAKKKLQLAAMDNVSHRSS